MHDDASITGPAPLSGRCCVLLQGPSSMFFAHLGKALRELGADVHRVGFAPGDRIYWRQTSGRYVAFKGTMDQYPDWIASLLGEVGATDLLMLGDGRFYHKEAIRAARTQANPVRLSILEHGLIRPGLILVDPDGLGASSRIRERFEKTESTSIQHPASHSLGGSFLRYALLDLGYNMSNVVLGPLLAPQYQRHSLDHPIKEYTGWVRKAVTRPIRIKRDAKAERRLADRPPGARFLFPLQLATDFQVRDHGTGAPMEGVLADVIESFRSHAPGDATLVVKRHPLDNGWTPWRTLTYDTAHRSGVGDRVVYLDAGDLEQLLADAAGVVTVNSTVGLTALRVGVSCTVLGTAVYDLPGLTSGQSLDDFWTHPKPPHGPTVRNSLVF